VRDPGDQRRCVSRAHRRGHGLSALGSEALVESTRSPPARVGRPHPGASRPRPRRNGRSGRSRAGGSIRRRLRTAAAPPTRRRRSRCTRPGRSRRGRRRRGCWAPGGAVTLPVRSTPEALRRVQKSVPRHPWRGARGIGGVPSRARATAMLAGPPPGRARSASSSELDRTGSVKASATHSPRTVTLTGAWGRAPWCLSVSLRKSAGREGHRNGWPDAALAQVLTCHSRRT
jgi:hypothetical protein